MERQPTGAPVSPARASWPQHLRLPTASFLIVILVSLGIEAQSPPATTDRRQQTRFDEALRREGDAVLAIADAAMHGEPTPSDFAMEWRNDFLKAQPGTFVPFTIEIDPSLRSTAGALMYVRVVRGKTEAVKKGSSSGFAYETIFPVEADDGGTQPVRVRRGFAVAPGSYTVYVVLRERPADLLARREAKRRGGVLVRQLEVPDFWTGELTTSTIMLADRVETVATPIPPSQLEENPYVIGTSRVYPSSGSLFRRDRELIVVFLIYNPQVGTDKHFDVQVDYHLYRRNREVERYVTRTNPQRFTPSTMGPSFDPASGQPVLAGQGILLSEFETGDYRLGITVTDLVSRKSVSRNVTFSVIGS